MGKTHKPYPPEFRHQMVERVRAGRSPCELAREFEPSVEAIRSWVKKPTETRAGARRVMAVRPAPSARNWLGCGVRTSSCAWSATFWQRRRPGSHGRPARSHPGLPVHEGEPGRVPDSHHGPRARRLTSGLLRRGGPLSLPARQGRSRPPTAHAHHPCPLARNVWRAADPRRVEGGGPAGRLQACGAADAPRGAVWRQSTARAAHDHPGSEGCLVPGFDGALLSLERKDPLWAKFSMGAPGQQRRCVERYNIVKRA